MDLDLKKLIEESLTGDLFRDYQDFVTIVEKWETIVGLRYLKLSQPRSIQDGTLQINVVHPTVSSDLQLKKLQILRKINGLNLYRPITGIWCFSVEQLLESPPEKSQVSQLPSIPKREKPKTALEALEQWKARLEQEHHPSCPHCGAISTQDELDRWGVCSSCITVQFEDYFNKTRML